MGPKIDLKGFEKFVIVQHNTSLTPNIETIFTPNRRRYPKEEAIECNYTQRIICLDILEPFISFWFANNVLAKKKDSGIISKSDLRLLNDLTVTDLYPVENIRGLFGLFRSKKIFRCSILKMVFTKSHYIPILFF